MSVIWSIKENKVKSNYEVVLKDPCNNTITIVLYSGDLYKFTYFKNGESITKTGRFITAELFNYTVAPGFDPNSNILVDFSEQNAANIEKIYLECIKNIEAMVEPDPAPRPKASIWQLCTAMVQDGTITLEDNTITNVITPIDAPIQLVLNGNNESGIGMYKARITLAKDIMITDITIPTIENPVYKYNGNIAIPYISYLETGCEYLISVEYNIISIDLLVDATFEPRYPINLMAISKGTTEHQNKDKYTVTLHGHNTINIGIPNMDALVSYESSNPAQGSGKWIAILIQIDTNLLDVQYRTTGQFNPFIQADIDEAKSIGAADEKTFVWWIKAETIGVDGLNFELIKNNTGIMQKIFINFSINYEKP